MTWNGGWTEVKSLSHLLYKQLTIYTFKMGKLLLNIYFRIQNIKEEFNCILLFVNDLFYSTKETKKSKPADCSQKDLTFKIKDMLHLLLHTHFYLYLYDIKSQTHKSISDIWSRNQSKEFRMVWLIYIWKKWKNWRHAIKSTYMVLRRISHPHPKQSKPFFSLINSLRKKIEGCQNDLYIYLVRDNTNSHWLCKKKNH